MKYVNKTSITLVIIIFAGYLSMYNSSGSYTSNGGRTGASFDNGTCSNGSTCHNTTGSFSPTTTLQLFDGTTAVTSYTANHSYTLRITTSSTGTSSSTKYGFQAVSVKSSNNNNVNGWGTMPSGTKTVTISGRTYASHSTRMSTGVVNIPWTSPATNTGNITFYAAGMVADGNFQRSGDNVATNSLTITASTAGCAQPTPTPTITHVDCNGDNTGAISVVVSSGTAPYFFSWTGPNSFTSSAQNISNLFAGQYRLIVTATGGCKDTINPVINQPASKLVVSPSANTPTCVGDNIALMANASGGTTGYIYSWIGPLSFGSSNANPMISPAVFSQSGDYIVTVIDGKNCTAFDTVKVQVDSIPMIDKMTIQKVAENTYTFSMDNPRFVDTQQWFFGDGKNSTLKSITHTYTSKNAFVAKLIISNHCKNDTFTTNVFNWPTEINNTPNDALSIHVYPNPSNTSVNLITKSGNPINRIRITSLEGVIIHQLEGINTTSLKLETHNYPSGLYMLDVSTQKGSKSSLLKVIH